MANRAYILPVLALIDVPGEQDARSSPALGAGGEPVHAAVLLAELALIAEAGKCSNLVQRLASVPLPASTRVTVIWSRSDALVPGARQARLPGAEEIDYDDLGHVALLLSRRVARDIIARLQR